MGGQSASWALLDMRGGDLRTDWSLGTAQVKRCANLGHMLSHVCVAVDDVEGLVAGLGFEIGEPVRGVKEADEHSA
ncbi:MAG: hypothetical protein LQ340_004757 [Diploschistes diacapsis]|nr:MAG: hypothetical protein LQ340_004757 [Diploschistes diacapsis]